LLEEDGVVMPAGDELIPTAPSTADYLRLRREARLHEKSDKQASAAIGGSWAFCHISEPGGEVVAMGRTIGDGGWYFLLADVVTAAAHRRHGHARRVVSWLLADIRARSPEGGYVALTSSVEGRLLFEGLGFRGLDPSQSSMQMVLD
jgi:GNAT superfamily N-acetyltransferase